MLEELHNQRSFLNSPIMAGSVQGKVSSGTTACVNVKAGPAVTGYKSCYFLGAGLNTSTVNGHETQWAFESEVLLDLFNFRHRNQILRSRTKPYSPLYQRRNTEQEQRIQTKNTRLSKSQYFRCEVSSFVFLLLKPEHRNPKPEWWTRYAGFE
jgi:hypothetical protein